MNQQNNCKTKQCQTTTSTMESVLTQAPTSQIPQKGISAEEAYRMVKDETYAQTQPRLNLATFVTTYMEVGLLKLRS